MQYIEGTTVSALIPRPHGQPHLPLILEVLTRVSQALDYAHNTDVLHRDVIPSNILIGHSTEILPALTDFGIARFYLRVTTFAVDHAHIAADPLWLSARLN